MADYPSLLTGAQMDSALMDVAQHNSEAWAVGTRNGFDVQSGDATYNNNARYYANRAASDISSGVTAANAAAARAEAAVPAGTAGAVFFDRSQSLTDAQKEQARANIAAAGSNRNLLDNPWFGINEVVNQNGTQSGNTNNVRAVDRWYFSTGTSGATWQLWSAGILLTPVSGSSGIWFQQQLESTLWNYLVGKRCTGSVLLSDGTIRSGSVVLSTSANNYFWHTSDMEVYCGTSGKFLIYVRDTAVTIRAAKLELGNYSTLASDTLPDYEEELRKCQKYFLRANANTTPLGFGFTNSAGTMAYILIPTPVRMRNAITSSPITGTFSMKIGGTHHSVSSVSVNGSVANGVYANISGTFAGDETVCLYGGASAYIDISADIQ